MSSVWPPLLPAESIPCVIQGNLPHAVQQIESRCLAVLRLRDALPLGPQCNSASHCVPRTEISPHTLQAQLDFDGSLLWQAVSVNRLKEWALEASRSNFDVTG